MTYVAQELEPVTAHPDVTGKLHLDRDDALEANFEYDFRKEVGRIIEQDPLAYGNVGFLVTCALIKGFIETNPDMVRVILGDRDLTGLDT